MTDAPRYRLVGYDIGTAPDENGGWVHWTDHEADIARLTAERDAALVQVASLCRPVSFAETDKSAAAVSFEKTGAPFNDLPYQVARQVRFILECRAIDAAAALARIERDAEARGMGRAAARARVYASNYEQSSDGRNTFILLAEWADAEAAAILARAAEIEKEAK